MTARRRTPALGALALAAALPALLALAIASPAARADQAYDQVAAAYQQAGGRLDPCAFTAAQLEAALRGIPPAIASTVPDIKRAIQDGIAAHQRGECRGRQATGGAAGGAAPPATTTPTATTPLQVAPAQPPATATQPTTTTPAPAGTTTAQPAAGGGARTHDRRPLVIALVAAGALLLLGLLLWGWARLRGWDPAWVARMRHGWGEAGFRASSTWSEFADWLRLGR